MIADAHLHLFSRGFPGRYKSALLGDGPDIRAYEGFRAAHDIAAGLVVGYEANDIDPGNNTYIRTLAADRPWLTTLAYLPVSPAPREDAVARLIADGHAGIAVYLPDAATAEALLTWPRSVWNLLRGVRAILSLNARPEATAVLRPIIESNPDCSFLFSHLGLPGAQVTVPTQAVVDAQLAPLLDLAKTANAMVKISGLYAVSEPAHAYPHEAARLFIETLLERFGPRRCLWGSDFSPALDFVTFAQTLDNPWLDGLSEGDRALVMGGNLLGLLRPSTQS